MCEGMSKDKGLLDPECAPSLQASAQERLLQNVNVQMAREEYDLNGQQGLDELLSVFAADELQARPRPPTTPAQTAVLAHSPQPLCRQSETHPAIALTPRL
jgi:hypothetical protein